MATAPTGSLARLGGASLAVVPSHRPVVAARRAIIGDPSAALVNDTTADPGPPLEQARVIPASVAGMHVVNVYVVNGKAVRSAEYELQ
jgi:exonuclease III